MGADLGLGHALPVGADEAGQAPKAARPVIMTVVVPMIMSIVRVVIAVLVAVVGRVGGHFSPAGPAPGAGAVLAGAHRLSRFPNFQ
jgi:hypothetical protein